MLYLLLSILSATLISLVFKAFRYFPKVKLFHAITFNYWVCVLLGVALLGESPLSSETLQLPWLGAAVFLGLFFVGSFQFVGLTVAHFGVAVASVTQRMSLIIPVLVAFWYYGEAVTAAKIVGILLALVAVVLTNKRATDEQAHRALERLTENRWLLLLPILLYVTSAIAEVFLQYLQRQYFDGGGSEQLLFTVLLFMTAAVAGSLVVFVKAFFTKDKIHYQSVLAGVALGIPNLGSIYFLLKSLGELEGSVVFPLTNVSVIAIVSVFAYFLFKERLTVVNIVGILLAILAILFIGVFEF